jgi:hypothetical protein
MDENILRQPWGGTLFSCGCPAGKNQSYHWCVTTSQTAADANNARAPRPRAPFH